MTDNDSRGSARNRLARKGFPFDVRLPGFSVNFTRFAMVGAFVFCWGISLNITLVSTLQLPKLPAYALVVASQAVIGFLSSRYFVFDGRDRCVVKTGIGYFTLFTLFRLADWTLYSITVKWWGVPYLAAQVANNFLFFLAKFVTYRMLFEGADDPSRPEMTTHD